ncbi:CLUMA_CG009477, isoform A [Clunio marinus]|uniref:CLUMA_CG009477, isoform A n=1 Tax=Clunio marinus TaxID=568069 RepID=A0A1J1I713_9DIPT|nr:CLUMA_CG009477, isoform A [Clunio marinus]
MFEKLLIVNEKKTHILYKAGKRMSRVRNQNKNKQYVTAKNDKMTKKKSTPLLEFISNLFSVDFQTVKCQKLPICANVGRFYGLDYICHTLYFLLLLID